MVQTGHRPLPRKPQVKKPCFLATLRSCKRGLCQPGEPDRAGIHTLGEGAEGALGLGVPESLVVMAEGVHGM